MTNATSNMTMISTNIVTSLTLHGDVFVVPNKGHFACDYINDHAKMEAAFHFQDILKANGIKREYEECYSSTPTFQTWVVIPKSEDNPMSSTDLGSHGSIHIPGSDITVLRFDEHLPVELFAGKKEGDVIEITIPCKMWTVVDHIDVRYTVPVKFSLRLAQKEYRYRMYGTFESALKAVTPSEPFKEKEEVL